MNYREFGTEHRDTILLLHGGGLSWWNYQAEAELLQSEYRVVLPILDGHAGSDRPFTSIESNAAELVYGDTCRLQSVNFLWSRLDGDMPQQLAACRDAFLR